MLQGGWFSSGGVEDFRAGGGLGFSNVGASPNSGFLCVQVEQKRELGSRIPDSAQVADDFAGGVCAARAG